MLIEKYFEDLIDGLEKNPPEDKNDGHISLIKDVAKLFCDARGFEFDDFRNKKHSTPKLALINDLQKLIENTKDGKYDN